MKTADVRAREVFEIVLLKSACSIQALNGRDIGSVKNRSVDPYSSTLSPRPKWPLLAQSGHWAGRGGMTAFGAKRTLGWPGANDCY
jgi:hypothetical protein